MPFWQRLDAAAGGGPGTDGGPAAVEAVYGLRRYWRCSGPWRAVRSGGSNLLALYAYAGQLAAAGRGSLFDFVSHLPRLAGEWRRCRISAARQESGGVQLMTIHKSKGLEFPVVILADLQKGFNRDDFQRPGAGASPAGTGDGAGGSAAAHPVRYRLQARPFSWPCHGRVMAEEMRILYVAMTRAKEKLICVDCMRFARKRVRGLLSAGGLSCGAGGRGRAPSAPGDWLLLPLLCTPEAAVLRQWADMEPEQPALCRWRLAGAAVGEPGVRMRVCGCRPRRRLRCRSDGTISPPWSCAMATRRPAPSPPR